MHVTFIIHHVLLSVLAVEYSLVNAFSDNQNTLETVQKLLLTDRISPVNALYVSAEHNLIETSDIPVNCSDALESFTDKAMNFTRCSLLNARPIRLCRSCESELNATKKAYERLRALPDVCQTFFFNSDQIGIIDTVYIQAQTLWNKTHCENCFKDSNETSHFFDLSDALDLCIQNSNKSSEKNSNSTCELCHNLYVELNALYNKFVNAVKQYDSGMCMDIVDQMNITRRMWNKQNCVIFNVNIGYPNVLTAVLVGTMPVFFYLLAKNVSIIEDVKLVRPKRKSYASMQPPQ